MIAILDGVSRENLGISTSSLVVVVSSGETGGQALPHSCAGDCLGGKGHLVPCAFLLWV